jgi:hypothetical protein
MSKKNKLPVTWMLGIIVILIAIVCWTNQAAKNAAGPAGTNISSPNNFFQFLENLFGIGPQGPYQNKSLLPGWGHVQDRTSQNVSPSTLTNGNPLNMESAQATASTAGQGLNASEQGSNTENNAENNSEINPENNAENNSETNAQNSSGLNAENNPENNQGINAENSQEYNQESNAENNSGINAETPPENNSGGNSGTGLGSPLGGNEGNNPQCIPQCYPECNPGCNADNYNQYNLPTLNHIPSDAQVSQSITQQNQANTTLSTLLATRQALVTPVLQQAQALKYQVVNSQDIPAPSTNPPPDDIKAKVQSRQYSFH